jgi:flagellar biogenesis protein FliO
MLSFLPDSTASSINVERLMKGAMILVGALFLLWLIVWLLPSSAPPPVHSDATGTVAAQTPPSGVGPTLVTPGRLLVVFLLAGGIGFALYLRQRSSSTPRLDASMHVLGRLSITQDQQLTLVRCQEDVLLLGLSPNGITLLRTYSEGTFPAASATDHLSTDYLSVDAPPASPKASLSGFATILRQYTRDGRHA